MRIPEFNEIIEPTDQTEARREHLDALRELVGNVYPNKFVRSAVSGEEDTITNVLQFAPVVEIVNEIKGVIAKLAERERPPAEIKDALNARLKEFGNVRISGRLTTPPRGNFVHLTDGINKLQIYAKKEAFNVVHNDSQDLLEFPDSWTVWQFLDHGDFVGVEGYLFITNTGELSVHIEKLQFLAKAMLPMPDKMHGIADAEIRQRQRYYDLIGSSLAVEQDGMTTRQVFETRARIISALRRYLEDHGYVEVETPMLTPKATGAAAKPFKTHHNALDIDLYARIAPELYLKRLVVGGFEKVYELNRNFRNEGISYKHNPEFTMLEFYCAYMDVEGMMNFCEDMMRQSVKKATGGLTVKYEGNEIDFSKFERLTMIEAITSKLPNIIGAYDPKMEGENKNFVQWLREKSNARFFHKTIKNVQENWSQNEKGDYFYNPDDKANDDMRSLEIKEKYKDIELTKSEIDQDILALFEDYVEEKLLQPTFIIDYPKSISPLSKASPANPQIAERFELFINGMEIANGFSELNDPREQYERFVEQNAIREGGDEEAMILDEDYIRALSYGMPPAAGIGIGIDRLVMLLTNKHSIRDVILFPHMRPEKREGEKGSEGEEEN